MKIAGIPASPGIAIGPVVVYESQQLALSRAEISAEQAPHEWQRIEEALRHTRIQTAELRQTTASRVGEDEATIFDAHLLMLEDEVLLGDMRLRVLEHRQNAEAAVWDAIEWYRSQLSALDNEYLRARAADLEDIRAQILACLQGVMRGGVLGIKAQCIIAARDLLPSDTASLDVGVVLALVTEEGGPTAHTAILARQLGLPAVVGAVGLLDALRSAITAKGTAVTVAVDGEAGSIEIAPDSASLAHYQERHAAHTRRTEALDKLLSLSAITPDGHHVELLANIGTHEEAAGAANRGAMGVGLFRTEFLFLDRQRAPTEDEQVAAYVAAASPFGDGWVTVRTLDIGGDKVVPYLPQATEENPVLGLRGLRLCFAPHFRPVFMTQLRALLRAVVEGARLRVMFPMVNDSGELRQGRALLHEAAEALEREGVGASAALARLQVGAMIETPAAAFCTDVLAEEADFFSIGTNDLTQYMLAVDRMNTAVAPLYNSFAPAVLRAIRAAVAGAHDKGRPIAMCGEMAGDLRATPLLLGLGLDEFSMAPKSLPEVKQIVRSCSRTRARDVVGLVYRLSSATEVVSVLANCVAELMSE